MTEYREINVDGTAYQRARTIVFENPRNSIPSVLIKEEKVHIFQDNDYYTPSGEIRKEINDFSIIFPLINPTTNEIIEGQTGSYQNLYILLYSLYWHLAKERDTALNDVIQ